MGKNIKIYSLIIAIIYCAIIIQTIYEGALDFKSGFEAGMNDARNNVHSELFHIKVEPANGQFSFPEVIKNTLTGENINAEVGEYKLKISSTHKAHSTGVLIFNIFKTICAFAMLAAFIYIPFLFFSIIKSVNKGGILQAKTIKKISRIGWILLGVFIYTILVYNIGDAIVAKQIISLEGYKIVPNFSNFSSLFLSIIVLFLGEILKHTAKLKEEQELTI
jgi:hypothetical protein